MLHNQCCNIQPIKLLLAKVGHPIDGSISSSIAEEKFGNNANSNFIIFLPVTLPKVYPAFNTI